MISSPSKQTIWLHIGTEKTGSTSIQNACMSNRGILAAAGVLYPQAPLLGSVQAHPGLVHFAATAGDEIRLPQIRSRSAEAPWDIESFRSGFLDKLAREIEDSRCTTILMSSEHLYSRLSQPASVEKLVASLRTIAAEVKVIAYLRPQYQLLPSLYSTQVKGGRTRKPLPLSRIKDRLYNYNAILERWEGAAGLANVTVRRFGGAYFFGHDLLADFFHATGVTLPEGFKPPAVARNQALDADAIEFLRVANEVNAKSGSKVDPSSWHAMIKQLEALSDRDMPVVSPDMLKELDAMYKPSNRLVAARHFPGETDLFRLMRRKSPLHPS